MERSSRVFGKMKGNKSQKDTKKTSADLEEALGALSIKKKEESEMDEEKMLMKHAKKIEESKSSMEIDFDAVKTPKDVKRPFKFPKRPRVE